MCSIRFRKSVAVLMAMLWVVFPTVVSACQHMEFFGGASMHYVTASQHDHSVDQALEHQHRTAHTHDTDSKGHQRGEPCDPDKGHCDPQMFESLQDLLSKRPQALLPSSLSGVLLSKTLKNHLTTVFSDVSFVTIQHSIDRVNSYSLHYQSVLMTV